MLRTLLTIFILTAPMAVIANTANKTQSTKTPKTENPEQIFYNIGIHLMPSCGETPIKTSKDIAQKHLKTFQLIDNKSESENTPTLAIEHLKHPEDDVAPPSPNYLKHFANGFNEQQLTRIQTSKQLLLLQFAYPRKNLIENIKQIQNFTHKLAKHCDGFIYDSATREVFTPAAWLKERIQSWHNDIPDMFEQTVIHPYQENELMRGISLGMEIFGLPDVVVNNYTFHESNRIIALLYALIQTIGENGAPQLNKPYIIDINKIKHPDMKKWLQQNQYENAEKNISVTFKQAQTLEGDAPNLTLEIDFSQFKGKKLQEQQSSLLNALLGSQNTHTLVKHDELVKAASEAALKQLPRLREKFNKGLPTNEYIIVKASFEHEEGREWMWVEITKWQDETITGILLNQPRDVPNLNQGAEVTVTHSQLFDYVYYFADGTEEGNETGKLMHKGQ